MSPTGSGDRSVVEAGRIAEGNGNGIVEPSGAEEVAEVERLRAELAAARAEVARLGEENRRLRAGPAGPNCRCPRGV